MPDVPVEERSERIDVEDLVDDVDNAIGHDPYYGEQGEISRGLNALATMAKEIERLREIEEAAWEIHKQIERESTLLTTSADESGLRDVSTVLTQRSVVRLRTALDAERGGEGG